MERVSKHLSNVALALCIIEKYPWQWAGCLSGKIVCHYSPTHWRIINKLPLQSTSVKTLCTTYEIEVHVTQSFGKNASLGFHPAASLFCFLQRAFLKYKIWHNELNITWFIKAKWRVSVCELPLLQALVLSCKVEPKVATFCLCRRSQCCHCCRYFDSCDDVISLICASLQAPDTHIRFHSYTTQL